MPERRHERGFGTDRGQILAGVAQKNLSCHTRFLADVTLCLFSPMTWRAPELQLSLVQIGDDYFRRSSNVFSKAQPASYIFDSCPCTGPSP